MQDPLTVRLAGSAGRTLGDEWRSVVEEANQKLWREHGAHASILSILAGQIYFISRWWWWWW
jgi:hypothetical protein